MSGRGALMLAMSAWLVLGAVAAAAQEPVSELPDLEDTGVVIPWSDFKQILEEIRRPSPIPTPVAPPVAFAMSECAATVVVGADQRLCSLP